MKKLTYILLLLVSTVAFSQSNTITYQAVIYLPTGQNAPGVNVTNVPMTNKNICLQFSFIDANNRVEYQEEIKVKTDEFGMVNITIGNGDQSGGYASSFDAIVWNASVQKNLQVALDARGLCNQFEILSNEPIASVPFANAAITAGNVSGVVALVNGGTGATTAAAARTNLGIGNIDNTSDLNKPLSTATKTYVDTAITGATIVDADATTKGKIQLAGDLAGTAAAPTVPGLALKENAANKSTTTTLGTSDVLFPTQNAVKTYIDTAIAGATIVDADATTKGKIQLAGDLAGTAAAPTVPGLALKENAANKSTTTTLGTSNVLYPTQNAVKTYVDTAIAGATIVDADDNKKGKIQLTGDLGGTASAPTVPGLALKLDASLAGVPNGLATLNSAGIIPASQLPPISVASTNVVGNQAEMLALSAATVGSIAVRTDVNKNFILSTAGPSVLANWIELLTPGAPVQSVNGLTGAIQLSKADINLANVDNTSDAAKPVSTATQNALNLKLNTNQVGVPNGTASLNALGKIPTDQIPAISFSSVKVLGSQAEMLAQSNALVGSVVIRTDVNKNYVLAQTDPSILANWLELLTPAPPVQSVNGYVGNVSLTKADLGLADVDNTGDINKPVSTATQNALDLKANLASPTFTGTVGGITKSMVGLANVDNTTDLNKPVSTPTQNALDLKANLASPTFSGTVSGITKAMVGLGNVDNTTDAAKPVSTATQTALDLKANVADVTSSLALKANLASPTFTGTVSGIDKTMVGLGNVDNTTDAAKPVSTATQTALNLKANAADVTTSLALKEDASNKSTITTLGTSDSLYPTQNAVKTYVDTAIAGATIVDADATTKGKIQLAGDLTGAAASPSVATGAITEAKLADNSVTSSKIKDGEIVNADLSDSAAIADTKLATIATAGKVSNSATSAKTDNTALAIVARDANGDFAAGTITASLTGNVTGNVSGTSANVTEIVAGVNGGTGVANTGKTITLGGNLITSGSFATTLTTTATTNVTLPTTGTLVTLDGTETLANKTLTSPIMTTPTLGVATATSINGLTPTAQTTGFTIAGGTISKTLTVSDDATVSGSNTGDQTTITGNAGTATKLAATKNINGVAFDGSADITVTADASTLSGTSLNSTVVGSSLTSVGTLTNLTVTNAISGSITGNAATVTTNANLTGPITSVGNATTITDGAVTTAKILDGTIAVGDLADDAVETAKIKNAAVTNAKLDKTNIPLSGFGAATADVALGGKKLTGVGNPTDNQDVATKSYVDGLNAAAGVSDGSITSAKILDGTIAAVDIADGTITGPKLNSNLYAAAKTFTFYNLVLGAGGPIAKISTDDGGNKPLSFYPNFNVESTRFWGNGNVTIQTGGTFTDNGYKLEVDGTTKFNGNSTITGTVTGTQFTSTATTGTAPFVVTSTTPVANLSIGGNAATVTTNAALTGDVTSTGNTSTIAADAVTSAKIKDGEIVNADLSASAAIADTKLATIATTGKVSNSATTATDANTPSAIVARDANGDFTAGTITANLTGVASKATNLNGGSLGDIAYQSAANTSSFLSGNISATKKFLTQTGTGSASVAPAWDTLGTADLTDLGTNVATFLATPSSLNLFNAMTNKTGTGSLVFNTSPTLFSPTLGIASATSINKVTITAPSTGSTLTIADGKTLTANNSIILAGTDDKTMTFPTTDATIARTDAAQTFTGTQTFSSDMVVNSVNIGRGKGAVATNTAVGTDAIGATATGADNAALGYNALKAVTSGARNTAVGSLAATSLTTGNDNSALGFQALKNNTTGASNVAIGKSSLINNTTGISNIAIGTDSGLSNTTGNYNIAVGQSALGLNTTGVANSAIGGNALYATIGNYNSALGWQSLAGNTTGIDNVAVGYNAGRYDTTGTTAMTSSSFSVYLGASTKGLNATGSVNETVIGNDAVGLGSNSTVIGNSTTTKAAIYGALSLPDATDSTSSTTGALKVTGGVGIAKSLTIGSTTVSSSTATGALKVAGGAGIAGNAFIGGTISIAGGAPAAGKVLTSTDSSGIATWETPAGVTTMAAIGSTPNSNGATISGRTLNLEPADATNGGIVTTGTQTFAGAKTFSPTLTAAADGETLVGLDINPTFTNGSYAGLTNYGLRVQGIGFGRGGGAIESNIAIGSGVLIRNSTGAYNTGLGYRALLSNTTGSGNTSLGSLAGAYTGATGSGGNASGTNSTFIGYNTSPLANGDDNEVVIAGGNATTRTVGLGSNSTLIGNAATTQTRIMGALDLPNATGSTSTTTGALKVAGGAGIVENLNVGGNTKITGTISIAGGTPGAGKVLTSTDNTGIASWVAPAGVTTMAAIGSTPNANGATISGANLNLQPANDTYGGIVTTGTQTFAGAKTFNGNTAISGTNTLTVGTGATALGGTLAVTGATTLNGNTSVSGTNTLTVGTGATALGGTLAVTGATTLNGNTSVSGTNTLTVGTGATALGGTLAVTGATTLNGNTSVSGTNTLTVGTGATALGGTLAVTGATTLSSTLGVTGNVAVNTNKFTVEASTGNTVIAGTLKVAGGSPGAGKVLTSDANGLASWTNASGSAVTTTTTGYVITLAESIVFYTGSAAGTFTIPDPDASNLGKEITVKNKTAFGITITASTGKIYIDSANTAATSVSIGIEASNNWIKLVSDGSQWNVLRALF